MTDTKTKVLILCTGNSARSQMAQGFFEKHGADRFDAHSAGTAPTSVHPMTARVMEEAGVDMSSKRAKDVREFLGDGDISLVITVCSEADQQCPIFPGPVRKLHWPFEDPAAFTGSDGEKLGSFRGVRDRIEKKILAFVGSR
ncbi:MAG: arsenate reductase ArsC [Planctomycetota bacterium]|jgi:arsenate reductase